MAPQGGISGVAVGMATAGAFLLYIGIQGVPIRDGLKSITSGTLPVAPAKTSSAISAAESAMAESASGSGGNSTGGGAHPKLVTAAKKYLGVPYRLGGMSRRGLDCSGLVVLAFKDAYGVTPPRTTYTQIGWKKFQGIRFEEMSAGDVCYWPMIGPPSHCGIAVDGKNVIHAPRTGQVVKIVPWNRAFTGGAKPSVVRYTGPE